MTGHTEATGDQGAALTDLAAEFRHVLRAHATSFPGPVVDALLPIVAARLADERERIAQAIEAEAVLRDDNSQWRDGMEDAARIAREGGDRG